LPDQVPARHVEQCKGGLRDLTGPPVLGALNVPRESLHVCRVGPDDVARCELGDAREQGVGLVHHPDLADAREPPIGEQLEEGQLPPWCADDCQTVISDLHSPVTSGPRRRA
jgi:hypothetical protein